MERLRRRAASCTVIIPSGSFIRGAFFCAAPAALPHPEALPVATSAPTVLRTRPSAVLLLLSTTYRRSVDLSRGVWGGWVSAELDDDYDEDGDGGRQAGRPLLPGLEPLRLPRVVLQRALKALCRGGGGALELAGVDATALLELAQQLVLQVGDLREEADQRRVQSRRRAVPAQPGAAVRAEAGAAQGFSVAVGAGHRIYHGYLLIGTRQAREVLRGRPVLLSGELEDELQTVLFVHLLAGV